jgi:hypothetical protein
MITDFTRPRVATRPWPTKRDPVRAHHRDRLATAAAGTRLRLRHDLLAPPARLAPGRRLAAAARTAARPAPTGRPARPLSFRLRLRLATRALGGNKTGPSPIDRSKAGSKHHLITDANGVPLACLLTGANRPDITQLLPLVEAIPPLHGKRGRPRRRPNTVLADRGYDSQRDRQALRARGIRPSSPNAEPSTDPDSAGNAGWSSARSPGCISTDASASGTNAAPTSIKPSSASPAA